MSQQPSQFGVTSTTTGTSTPYYSYEYSYTTPVITETAGLATQTAATIPTYTYPSETITETAATSYTTAIPLPSTSEVTTTTVTTGATVPLGTTSFRVADQVLTATAPIEVRETETATVFGQTGVIVNREDIVNWTGPIPLSSYPINDDPNPEIIRKRTDQLVQYTQEIAVRYLRPPTPPAPGDIIIREENPVPIQPAPPLVIRQQPPRPLTPAPLVIRESPPKPPALIGQKLVTISAKRLPPPPRKVIIERLPPIPAPPQSVLIERWLAYPQLRRHVIFQRAALPPVVSKPKNVIVQWEAPSVEIRKEFRDLGVARANPVEYVERYGSTLKQYYELPQFVRDIRPTTGLVLAAECPTRLIDLEGDVEALCLIDLDREGLQEYKSYADQYRQTALRNLYGTREITVNLRETYNRIKPEIISMIQRDQFGKVTTNEARRILDVFNQRLGRTLCVEQTDRFLNILDRNHTGFVDYNEFVRALDYSVL